MGWREWVFGTKAAASPTERPMSVVYSPGSPAWTSWNYQAFAREAYSLNPYVYRGIRMVGSALGGIPWGATDPEGSDLDPSHPLIKLLRFPNPLQSLPEFFENAFGSLALSGNLYLNFVGPNPELYILPPEYMKVIPAARQGDAPSFVLTAQGQDITYSAEEVRQLKLWNPLDPVYGLSPLSAAGRSIDCNNVARTWNRSLLRNGGFPGLILSLEADLTKDQLDETYSRLEEWQGSDRAGKTLVVTRGKIDRAGLTPVELAFEGLSRLSAKEVALALGIPPQALGDTESQTYSNYQEARRALYTETVLPLADVFAAVLSAWLGPRFDDAIVTYDADDIEALREDQDKLWKRVNEAKCLTVDEQRGALGYEALPDKKGEVVLVFGVASTLEAISGSGGVLPAGPGLDSGMPPPPPGTPPEPTPPADGIQASVPGGAVKVVAHARVGGAIPVSAHTRRMPTKEELELEQKGEA